jgi:ubiquinol-cytochrome c reductase iron-sulfur subunit
VTRSRAALPAPERAEELRELGEPPHDPAASVAIGAMFVVAALAGLGLAAAILLDAPTPLLGVLVLLSFGPLGLGIVSWSHRLLPQQEYVEQRTTLRSDPRAAELIARSLVAERGFSRRRLLRWLLFGAVGGVTAAFLAPLMSLGPAPVSSAITAWKRGLRLVDVQGQPVHAADLPVDGVQTVFPEGSPGDALAQTALVHVDPALLQLPADRASWAPEGFVAYSRVCTHAGCPVSLYQATQHALICPCHQSQFEVLTGAQPVFGPAVRPLPQLPIQLQADGTFIALGDFGVQVGPSTWDMAAPS